MGNWRWPKGKKKLALLSVLSLDGKSLREPQHLLLAAHLFWPERPCPPLLTDDPLLARSPSWTYYDSRSLNRTVSGVLSCSPSTAMALVRKGLITALFILWKPLLIGSGRQSAWLAPWKRRQTEPLRRFFRPCHTQVNSEGLLGFFCVDGRKSNCDNTP